MMATAHRYAVVTPVRNEADYIERTLRAVTSQTIPPAIWVIVDDGSTDGTAEIVSAYARRFDYIRLRQSEERDSEAGKDRFSWGVDAVVFNDGLATLDVDSYDYVAKLDGDLEFAPDYFERIFGEFEKDPRLGIAAGHFHEEVNGRFVLSKVPDWHVRGASKIYRRQCFRDIGGVVEILAWDGVDEIRAQLTGWYSRAFLEPHVNHLRAQGAAAQGSRGGLLRGRARLGLCSYILHYHPLFVLARGARIGLSRPYLIGGIAYVYGYVRAVLLRPRRLEDREVIRFLRRSQLQRLVGRRPYAMSGAEVEGRRS
jgi:poly-beta-1,6-N-acetyl-D-glucosamine synthase